MHVHRDNFAAVLDPLLEHIQRCDFVVLDLEMTGITADAFPEDPTMTVDAQYRAKRYVSDRFSIIQVGLCLFESKGKSSSSSCDYVARPYNVFVFPACSSGRTGEAAATRDVVLSPSAIDFLRRHGMDFQRWMYNGVAYTDREGAARLAAELEAEQAEESSIAATKELLSEKEVSWLEDALKVALRLTGEEGQRIPVGREITLPPVHSANACAALRACVRGKPEIRDVVDVRIRGRRETKDACFVLKHGVAPSENSDDSSPEQLLINKLGFRLVFDALVKAKKPIVGHHCLSDLLFTLRAFEGPLPESTQEFCAMVTEKFPGGVFDTKYMTSYVDPSVVAPGRFDSTGLGSLYSHYGPVTSAVKIMIPEGFEAYHPLTIARRGRSAAHEAGYDALMTGTVFANVCAEFPDVREASVNKLALFGSCYALDVCTGAQPGGDGAELVARGELLDVVHPWGNSISALTQALPMATQLVLPVGTGRALVALETGDALKRAPPPNPLLNEQPRKPAMLAADVLDNISSARKNAELGGPKSPLSRVTAALFQPAVTAVKRWVRRH